MAALGRRVFGETFAYVNAAFPHWLCENFHDYSNREADLPVDQFILISLIAPRPVYIASASEDLWADPRGEYLAAKNARPVYELLRFAGLPDEESPDEVKLFKISYHLRQGKPDITSFDWEKYLGFADKHLKQHSEILGL